MPVYHRHFEPGQLQFITSSTYRRLPIFSTPSLRHHFVEALGAARSKLGFLLIGWVLMPEHFHLLLQPWPAESTSNAVKELKQRSAHAILEALRAQSVHFDGAEGADLEGKVCANLPGAHLPGAHLPVAHLPVAHLPAAHLAAAHTLRSLRLPPTVHDQARYRVWQRRFVPFNVFTEKKRVEKLDYMHHNPVKRGLVTSPQDWPWSSWRFYHLGDGSVLEIDRLG